MVSTRRSSARSSQVGATNRLSSARKTPASRARLNSVLERDETPDVAQPSIDDILATPTTARDIRGQLSQLSTLSTPKTEPKPERGEMHPKTIHQTTSKAPDSGLKLGFADISSATTNFQNTPTKSAPRQSAAPVVPSNFEFQFSSDANLSDQARQLMNNVREEAVRIKAQMAAEKAMQDKKDVEAESMYDGTRKIATAKGKAGRFSDVHMAQFKKMDSIANHPSSFRARPGFAAPTTQSLKRSPSKAGLDEPERPRTAGRTTVRQVPASVNTRVNSANTTRSTISATETSERGSPAKRSRGPEQQYNPTDGASSKVRPVTSSLFSPTKASLARATNIGSSSPEKASMLPRSNGIKPVKMNNLGHNATVSSNINSSVSPTRIPQSQSMHFKPLPALPTENQQQPILRRTQSVRELAPVNKEGTFSSKLPTFSGLKSILRSGRRENKVQERPGTPKRPNTAGAAPDSGKKVDFTPSVKSRYAVKLAAVSPSPAKLRQDTPHKSSASMSPYDSSAYLVQDELDEDWEDEDGEVMYPYLPSSDNMSGPVDHTFEIKAKEHERRESKEFKSIFTTLHPKQPDVPTSLTCINTTVNKTDPTVHANKIMRSPGNSSTKPSPSTIRRVRTSAMSSGAKQIVQPFEDQIKTVPHGIPGKKRRFESIVDGDEHGTDEDAKENRRMSAMPSVPGAWNDTVLDEDEIRERDTVDDEGTKRSAKRARMIDAGMETRVTVKKVNAAREVAAKNAKDRKGRSVLSLSRLNMLSRPKQRG